MFSPTNTIVLVLLLTAARTPAQQWRQVEGAGPGSARCGLAWHEGRGELVRFGGEYVRDLPHQETRVFDGVRWLPRPSANRPAASQFQRSTTPMTYDSVRGVVLLANAANGDLWEWNGTAWTVRAMYPNPTHSSGRAFAFDPVRGVAVLASSTGGSTTWEWNGSAWRQASTSDPASLDAAAFMPQRGRVVGVSGRDLYEWTGTAWALIASAILPNAPNARYAAAYDSWRSRLVIVDTNSSPMSVHEWDGANLVTRTPLGGPRPRIDAAAAFDPSRGIVVLCCGSSGNVGSEDTWAWDGQGWRELAAVPSAGATWMAYDSTRGRLVATGAFQMPFAYFTAGVWERDAGGWHPLAAGSAPTPGPLVFDPLRNQTVLVPPIGSTGPWLWNGTAWTTATANPAPAARYGAAMAFDLARGEAVLFGGSSSGTSARNDTWLWNGSSWRQAAPGPSPGPRYGHALAYDPVRQRTVLFGGAAGAPLADTWEWDGTSWSLQAPTASPPARSFHAMAFDGSRSVVTMTGGSHQILVNGSVVNVELPLELWDWNGSNWQNLPIAAAPTRRMHAMAFDGARGRLVVQGGLEPEGIVSTTQSRMVPSSDTFEFVRNGATVYSQGGACPFSGPRLRAESLPFTGNPSFALQLALADASLPAMLGFATTPAFSPLTFANGCRLHLGVPTFTSSLQVTNPGGAARWALAVAANPALRGIQLWAQGAVLDLALQPRTTDFLLLTIGE